MITWFDIRIYETGTLHDNSELFDRAVPFLFGGTYNGGSSPPDTSQIRGSTPKLILDDGTIRRTNGHWNLPDDSNDNLDDLITWVFANHAYAHFKDKVYPLLRN